MKNRALRAPISTRPSWADCGAFSLTGLVTGLPAPQTIKHPNRTPTIFADY